MTTVRDSAVAARLEAYSDDEVAAAAWRSGFLRHKLSPRQQGVYDDIKRQLWGEGGYVPGVGKVRLNRRQRRYILKCCRRYGKTFIAAVIACELCISMPHARVYWAAQTAKQVTNMIAPAMRIVLADVPEDLRPTYNTAAGVWTWPNGAEIHVAGCEDEHKAERLRGDGADLFIFDEAGHIEPLRYAYRSIALWMTARRMGRILMISSPAKSPGHAFTEYSNLAEAGEGGYSHRTVYQSDLTAEDIEEIKRECGGENTADWQREGLALDVVDTERAIMPEYTQLQLELTEAVPQPRWFDPIVAMDVGWSPDMTVALFGYWHFERALLVIEHEVAISRMTTDDLAEALRGRELEIWGDAWNYRDRHGLITADEHHPYRRVSDTSLQVICDLTMLHGMVYEPTQKDDKEAAINAVRVLMREKKIRIHPRCRTLISHLKAGVWNKSHSSFDRLPGFGHFDALDALTYFVRNVDRNRNPSPLLDPELSLDRVEVRKHVKQQRLERDGDLDSLADIFRPQGM